MPQGRIHHFLEPGVAVRSKLRALLEADPLGAVAATRRTAWQEVWSDSRSMLTIMVDRIF